MRGHGFKVIEKFNELARLEKYLLKSKVINGDYGVHDGNHLQNNSKFMLHFKKPIQHFNWLYDFEKMMTSHY